MSTLDRYVARRIAIGFLFAITALVAVFSVIDLLNEIEKVGTGKYQMAQALHVLLLELPGKIYDLCPPAALLGVVTALGLLAGRNEVIALFAIGVSRARLCMTVLGVGVVLAVLMVLLGELIAAPLAQRAETERSIALSGGLAMSTSNGFWARYDSRFLNVRSPVSEDELQDLYIYEFDDQHRMQGFTHARSAARAADGWMLQDVVESRFTDTGLATTQVAARAWNEIPGTRQIQLSFLPPEDLSLAELHRSIGALRERGESTLRFEAAFWSRLTLPLTALVMMFLGVPFVLGAPRGTKLGQRIAVAALVGIGFEMLIQTFAQAGLVYGFDPVTSAFLPAAVVLALAAWMLRRAH